MSNAAQYIETNYCIDEPDDYRHPNKHKDHVGKKNLYSVLYTPATIQYNSGFNLGAIHF